MLKSVDTAVGHDAAYGLSVSIVVRAILEEYTKPCCS